MLLLFFKSFQCTMEPLLRALMIASQEIYSGVLSVSSQYPAVLLDAYGVFWGGNDHGIIEGSVEVMQQLVTDGKIVGILSNSTQLSVKEIAKLEQRGLQQGRHFHFLLTSGDVVRNAVLKQELGFKTPNNTYWLFGGVHPKFASHKAIFENSVYKETDDCTKADFIYISVPHLNGDDQTDPEVFRSDVEAALKTKLPMLCPNPDQFAHEGKPSRAVVRQGTIAKMYEEMGGQVHYIGKPHTKVYSFALDEFRKSKITDPKHMLMVGDTPETDIRGAANVGMDSALILQTGNMADRIACKGLEKAMGELPQTDVPTYFINRL